MPCCRIRGRLEPDLVLRTTGINRYAVINVPWIVTRWINGGLNGYQDRLRWYTRAALVLLGHAPEAVREFQRAARLTIDGISGLRTRGALHDTPRRLPELGAAQILDEPIRHQAEGALGRIAAVMSQHRALSCPVCCGPSSGAGTETSSLPVRRPMRSRACWTPFVRSVRRIMSCGS